MHTREEYWEECGELADEEHRTGTASLDEYDQYLAEEDELVDTVYRCKYCKHWMKDYVVELPAINANRDIDCKKMQRCAPCDKFANIEDTPCEALPYPLQPENGTCDWAWEITKEGYEELQRVCEMVRASREDDD